MLTIHLDSPVPLAEQIRLGIRQAIAAAELAPGDPLPAVRQLANDLGVNFNTVARAYRELEQEGLVISRRGRGTVVTSASETVTSPASEVEARLADGLRCLLADARLAGVASETLRRLIDTEMTHLWSPDAISTEGADR